ncbi:pseudouridine synthase [Flavihumibacter sp. R14]|nr:pseudouridine synthase [Flavihumibacter soli]
MPIKNNRNSRDDKSTKFNKPARNEKSTSSDKRSKSDRPEGTNTTRKKLFGGDQGRPQGSFNRSEERGRPESGKPYGEKKSYSKDSSFSDNKRSDRKPFGDKPQGERKPYTSRPGDGEKRFERKPYGDRPQGERKSFGKSDDSRPERKPYGDRPQSDRKPYGDRPQGERKPFGRSDDNRSERKPYSSDRPQSDRKPYGDRPQGERKPFNRSDDNRSEKKPYGRTEGARPYSSDKPRTERRPFDKGDGFDKKPRTGSDENFRPYDRSKNYRKDDRKWSSEETLKTVNRSKKPAAAKDDGLIRLNRFIANAGICSRRKADELIAAGVVSVNGEPVTELGFKVDPAKDLVRYNGVALKREKMVYVLLNKPKDYITTTDDPQERKTVMKLVEKASKERIYPVGRLDRNTTGLLLMTNDGDLAEKLSHPRNNVTKIYQVELNRNVPQGDLNKIAFGLELEDGLIKPDQVSYVAGGSKNEIGIQIHSGKNRIVRRIFEHLGYEVVKLDRVVYSNLTKKDLPRGHWRYLEEKEIIQLKHLIK